MLRAFATSPRSRGWYRTRFGAGVLALCAISAPSGAQDRDRSPTATPIRHLIVLFGENRSFDHVFGTYKPRPGQRIDNLLSRGIVDENGRPGPKFTSAAQFGAAAGNASSARPTRQGASDAAARPQWCAATGSDAHPPPFATVAAARQPTEPQAGGRGAADHRRGACWRRTAGPTTASPTSRRCRTAPFSSPRDPAQRQELSYDAYTEDTIHRCFQIGSSRLRRASWLAAQSGRLPERSLSVRHDDGRRAGQAGRRSPMAFST